MAEIVLLVLAGLIIIPAAWHAFSVLEEHRRYERAANRRCLRELERHRY